MEQKSRMEDELTPIRLDNQDIQCGKCRYVMPETTLACQRYTKKPGYVLYGTKRCPEFKRKPWFSHE